MYYVKINSGIYGSSSRILDGKTEKLLFNKKEKDIDVRPFYLMIVFPKDHNDLKVQKGIFIFQNNGQYGVKTITTTLMQRYFSTNFDISINCLSIAPSAFIKKVLKKDSVKKMKLVKNFKSVDPSDNLGYGYGSEVRELSKLSFTDSAWSNIQDKMLHFCGSKLTLFEFQNVSYDDLKVVVDVGGKDRTINLHNIENVSIIEDIPEYIQAKDGHPKLELLIEYFKSVALDYMSEIVLRIK